MRLLERIGLSALVALLLSVLPWQLAKATPAVALAQAKQQAAVGQSAQALHTAEHALQTYPTDAQLRFYRAVLLHDMGRVDAAFNAFSELHNSHPELPDPLNNLAVIHASRGEWADARRRLEEALRNDPTHRNARENLGDVYFRLAMEQWQTAAADTRPEPALAQKLSLGRQMLQPVAPRR
jgi:Flp pilus assembly protein TadD